MAYEKNLLKYKSLSTYKLKSSGNVCVRRVTLVLRGVLFQSGPFLYQYALGCNLHSKEI